MEKKWWHDSVVYQIYPRSFMDSNGDGIGDIKGIISKLDYLNELGIDVIWLSPVYQSPMDDNGYDISDYRKIAAEFGTLEDLKNLFKEANAKGIKVVMDLVVNHTSDEHPWFIEAKKSKDNPYRDYYIWKKDLETNKLNDIGSTFGGSAWEYDEASGEYYFHLFSKKQPDLNWENPKVAKEVYDMMNWWLDMGISGFRMDVIDLIGKEIDKKIIGNGPRLHPLLQEMNKESFGAKDLLTVGETWGATPEVAKLYSKQERRELSMVFQFEHITAFWDEKLGKWKPKPFNLNTLKTIMNRWQTELGDEGWNSLFWNNHDLPRAVSKYGDPINYREESAKMLATVLHLQKGTPYIYQGEELGMTNVQFESLEDYNDIETLGHYKENIEKGLSHEIMMEGIYANSRDNARTPMQWSHEENAGFTTGTPWLKLNPNYIDINARAALENKNSVFYHYQQLIKLRKEHPVIVYGDFNLLLEKDPDIFAYTRSFNDKTSTKSHLKDFSKEELSTKLMTINNFSDKEVTLPTTFTDTLTITSPIKVLLNNYNQEASIELKDYTLKPYESIVLSY